MVKAHFILKQFSYEKGFTGSPDKLGGLSI